MIPTAQRKPTLKMAAMIRQMIPRVIKFASFDGAGEERLPHGPSRKRLGDREDSADFPSRSVVRSCLATFESSGIH